MVLQQSKSSASVHDGGHIETPGTSAFNIHSCLSIYILTDWLTFRALLSVVLAWRFSLLSPGQCGSVSPPEESEQYQELPVAVWASSVSGVHACNLRTSQTDQRTCKRKWRSQHYMLIEYNISIFKKKNPWILK